MPFRTTKPFQTISRQHISQNPYWSYLKDEYAVPSGEQQEYHLIQTRGSVLVVPELEDGRFVLVRQYRYIQQRWGLEFPGGGQKEHQPSLISAQEELREEAGMTAEQWHSLGQFAPCVGILDEMCEVFHATNLQETPSSPDITEMVELVRLTKQEIHQAIRTGELWSGMSQVAWFQYSLWLGLLRE